MSVKMVTTTVGGARWEMNTLPATTGLACLTQIGAIVGAPAGAVAGGIRSGATPTDGFLNLDAGVMGEAVAKMLARLAEPQIVDLVKTLLTSVRRNDKIVDFDDYFAANYGELAQLILWSMKENFASFLVGNPRLEGMAAKVKASIQAT